MTLLMAVREYLEEGGVRCGNIAAFLDDGCRSWLFYTAGDTRLSIVHSTPTKLYISSSRQPGQIVGIRCFDLGEPESLVDVLVVVKHWDALSYL